MRFNILKTSLVAISLALFAGCSDWTDPEVNVYDDCPLDEIDRDEAYYSALRAYKESDHAVAFGWFSGWGEGSTSLAYTLSAVPDSMDIISLWDGSRNLTPTKKADLEYVQKVKGTKVVVCAFVPTIGHGFTPAEHNGSTQERKEFWGWINGDDEAIRSAIAKYAKAISDTLSVYGYDGFDIDYEPSGELDSPRSPYFGWLVEELGQYFGPKSGTGKLFIIDGYVNWLTPDMVQYVDYFVSQAYSVSAGTPSIYAGTNAANKDARLAECVSAFHSVMTEEEVTNKFIITENVESAMDCLKGGFYWTDKNGTWSKDVMPTMVGFAAWQPANGFRKGGFGGYKFNQEAVSNTPYKWFRKAIQQQNPAPGTKILTDDDYEPAKY